MTYSKREREFTFANKIFKKYSRGVAEMRMNLLGNWCSQTRRKIVLAVARMTVQLNHKHGR